MSDRFSRALAQDWLLWGATGCALVGLAHSEWSLAVATGAHPWIAASLPGALDMYVIRALRVGRDVFLAVLAMVAANVAWYLVHSGDLAVEWQLRSAVGALAPLILWRVHSLRHTRNRSELLLGLPAGAVSAPPGAAPDAHPSAPEPVVPVPAEPSTPPSAPHPSALDWSPGFHLDGCDGVHEHEGVIPCLHRANELDAPGECAPGYAIPFDWSASPTVHLRAVPDLPGAHPAPELKAGDEAHLPGAQEYVDNCALTDTEPSVRGIRRALNIGQPKAERLLAHLLHEPEEGS